MSQFWIIICALSVNLFANLLPGTTYQKTHLSTFFDTFGDAGFACVLIEDSKTSSYCKGVLVQPHIVMTVAHGVREGEETSLTIRGRHRNGLLSVRAKKIWVHPRYKIAENGEHSAFDIAFIFLNESLPITPLPLAQPGEYFKDQLFYTMQWDPNLSQGYAFTFPEMDRFYRDSHDFAPLRTFSFCSIYFNEQMKCPPAFHALEPELRAWEARNRWIDEGKPPIGLCLPGSSGSPLLIKKNGQMYVLGVICAFAPAATETFKTYEGEGEAAYILNQPKEKVVNRYQSVFSLPYKVRQDLYASGKTWKFEWDPDIKKFIDQNF